MFDVLSSTLLVGDFKSCLVSVLGLYGFVVFLMSGRFACICILSRWWRIYRFWVNYILNEQTLNLLTNRWKISSSQLNHYRIVFLNQIPQQITAKRFLTEVNASSFLGCSFTPNWFTSLQLKWQRQVWPASVASVSQTLCQRRRWWEQVFKKKKEAVSQHSPSLEVWNTLRPSSHTHTHTHTHTAVC